MKKNQRCCAQCRTLTDRQFLMQIKHIETGFVFTSPQTFVVGRSIYLCRDLNCWKKAAKNKGILKGAHRAHREAWLDFCAMQLKEAISLTPAVSPPEQPQTQQTRSPLRI